MPNTAGPVLPALSRLTVTGTHRTPPVEYTAITARSPMASAAQWTALMIFWLADDVVQATARIERLFVTDRITVHTCNNRCPCRR